MKDLIKQILREETSENLKEDKLKSLIFKFINHSVEGVDVYKYKGDLWLIFTDSKQWVIRLTERGNLHYQYKFFQNIFKYFSMAVVENQHYITEWVEDTIKNGVKSTKFSVFTEYIGVEDTIKNGVKSTSSYFGPHDHDVEDTIKNGIKLNKS